MKIWVFRGASRAEHRRGRVLSGNLLAAFAVVWLAAAAHAAPVIDPATGHSYELIEEPETWADAEAAAERMGTQLLSCHLATIRSAAENAFVLTLLPPGGADMDVGEQDVWIGGQQRTNLNCVGTNNDPSFWGKWVTGEPWNYTNWNPDQPDDCDFCLTYSQDEEPRGWDEEDCSEERIYLVECEHLVGAPALSWPALIVLALLMAGSSWWILKRKRAHLRPSAPAAK